MPVFIPFESALRQQLNGPTECGGLSRSDQASQPLVASRHQGLGEGPLEKDVVLERDTDPWLSVLQQLVRFEALDRVVIQPPNRDIAPEGRCAPLGQGQKGLLPTSSLRSVSIIAPMRPPRHQQLRLTRRCILSRQAAS